MNKKMNTTAEIVIERARSFAAVAHRGQSYGEGEDYMIHLDAVAEILEAFGSTVVAIGYLHDVVEDTPFTLRHIEDTFGPYEARCVGLLTDPEGRNRKERKAILHQTLARLSPEYNDVLIVKAADRLANVQACIRKGKSDLFKMYAHEHPAFRQAAYRVGLCPDIWSALNAHFDTHI